MSNTCAEWIYVSNEVVVWRARNTPWSADDVSPQFLRAFSQQKFEYRDLLEYTQTQLNQSGRQLFGVVFEKKRFRPTNLVVERNATPALRRAGEWKVLCLFSWRNRDARFRNHVFGVQFSLHVYGTGTGVLPGA
jgi:hypothetical protein